MRRRTFLQSAAAFAALAKGEATGDVRDRVAIQAEFDAITPKAYDEFLKRGLALTDEEKAVVFAATPGLKRYDEAFDKVFAEAQTTVVTDRPAIWYVYNMGLVVKTPQALFAIDLNHRQAERFAPLLDFALVTHNHGDHFHKRFYLAMDGKFHKTVISNFMDNYGAFFSKVPAGYTRAEKTFPVKDVTIRTFLSDHNAYLIDFTTGFEISVGDFTLLHTGDSCNIDKINPGRTPDLWVVHPRCGLSVEACVAKFHPKCTVIAHLVELGHARDRCRWTLADGETVKAKVEAAGGKAVVPLWGDRIA